jgi:hypothetical protein
MDKGAAQRYVCSQPPQTAAQLLATVNRYERAASERERAGARDLWRRKPCDTRFESLTRNCEK